MIRAGRGRAAARAAVVVAGCAALSGCSGLAPYSTFPRAAPAGVHETGERVAVCHDPLLDSPEAVRKVAQGECGADHIATLAGTDWYMQYCPILLPARTTFVCQPKKPAKK